MFYERGKMFYGIRVDKELFEGRKPCPCRDGQIFRIEIDAHYQPGKMGKLGKTGQSWFRN